MDDFPEKENVGKAATRGAVFGAIAFPVIGRAFDVLGWSQPRLQDIPGAARKIRFVASEVAIGATLNAAFSAGMALWHNHKAKKSHVEMIEVQTAPDGIER